MMESYIELSDEEEQAVRLNDKGERVDGVRKVKPGFGSSTFDENGEEQVAWDKFKIGYADADGFDMRYKYSDEQYYICAVLEPGTMIIRYGPDTGCFTAPLGSKYENLGLPYIRDSVEFHRYLVKKRCRSLGVRVKEGKVAPIFDSEGGAVQYMHIGENGKKIRIRELIKQGLLERANTKNEA